MELTSKQRAYLRSLANEKEPFVHIGKEGVIPTVIIGTSDALDAHELVKIQVQKNAPMDIRDICQMVCERTGAQPVQVIGNRFVIYRPSKKKLIELPK